VPEGELRKKMVQLHHDTPVGGYGGRWKTTEIVTRNYWWPGVTKEVRRYIDGYNACQQYKNKSKAPAEKLMPNCHKLHLAISPSILQQFTQSQWIPKALKKTFRSILVTSRSNQ